MSGILNSLLRRRLFNFKTVFALLTSFLLAFPVTAQEVSSDENLDLPAAKLLADALLFHCDVVVEVPEGGADPWTTTVRKITIPGRAITVGLEGYDSQLEVHFTLYPLEDDSLFLVAKSETRTNDGYTNDLSSMRIEYRDEVYFYPLGRAGKDMPSNNVEIRMTIHVVPYLETLDDDARATLESSLETSALFDLSEEGD